MTLDMSLRNDLRNAVTRCCRLLEESVGDMPEHRELAVPHVRHIEVADFEHAEPRGV